MERTASCSRYLEPRAACRKQFALAAQLVRRLLALEGLASSGLGTLWQAARAACHAATACGPQVPQHAGRWVLTETAAVDQAPCPAEKYETMELKSAGSAEQQQRPAHAATHAHTAAHAWLLLPEACLFSALSFQWTRSQVKQSSSRLIKPPVRPRTLHEAGWDTHGAACSESGPFGDGVVPLSNKLQPWLKAPCAELAIAIMKVFPFVGRRSAHCAAFLAWSQVSKVRSWFLMLSSWLIQGTRCGECTSSGTPPSSNVRFPSVR